MTAAKGSPSTLKKAAALADCDDDVYSYLDGQDMIYTPDSDFFKGYLTSDCQADSIPSLGGKF
jgi:hypothetical protein